MVSPFCISKTTNGKGFTLVELSIVLVIIGLIIGGMLVGRELIDAAAIRAQISQIEKYNAAVNTFRGKYGYLPGDIPEPYASQQGFSPRGTGPGVVGLGDGDGFIEGQGACQDGQFAVGSFFTAGEPVIFWNDLTYANGMNINLIGGSFNTPGNCYNSGPGFGNPAMTTQQSAIAAYFPQAQIGQGNFIYVFSAGGANYFGMSQISWIEWAGSGTSPGLSVSQAYNIDRKIDDGEPLSGQVVAVYVSNGYAVLAGVSAGTAATASSTTCYDNGGNANAVMNYSMGQNNGAGINCALSFKFQ